MAKRAEQGQAKTNQTEAEFFALVDTGRKGVESMLATMGEEILKIAAPSVQKRYDVWTMRALVEITSNKDLTSVIQTRAGIFSIYRALTKCAQIDLQIGGQFPHAYLVPKSGLAVLMISAEGYAFASTHGQGHVLMADPLLVEVYEKDDCAVDQAAGTVKHLIPKAFADRGALLGYYMRLEYTDGHTEIPMITRDDVLGVIKEYSQKKSDGGLMPSYKKSPKAMERKTAMKQLLKRPMRMSEGLAMLYSIDGELSDPEPITREPETRNVTERVTERLSEATEALDPENAVEPAETPDPEPEKSGKDGEAPTEGEKEGPDLF